MDKKTNLAVGGIRSCVVSCVSLLNGEKSGIGYKISGLKWLREEKVSWNIAAEKEKKTLTVAFRNFKREI